MGEDIAGAEGPFKTSEGLLQRFGPERVRDTPISEMGFLGAALGAAMTGLRPVVEIMFIEFLGVALDQLVTEAAMMHYLSAGRYRAPLVVRASVGAGSRLRLPALPDARALDARHARPQAGGGVGAARRLRPDAGGDPRRRTRWSCSSPALCTASARSSSRTTTLSSRLGVGEYARRRRRHIVALGQTVNVALEAARRETATGWSAE